jgi:tRNA (adenine57-N1/adenine58-N1)-methyltransferase
MSEPKRLQAGEPVTFIDGRGREFWDVLTAGGQSDVRGDLVVHDDVIGQPDGGTVMSRKQRFFRVLSSTLVQTVQHMPKPASLVWPKDAALLVMWGDVRPGSFVIEGGLGSGALTMALLRAVGPTGRVVTYEVREDTMKRAVKNIRLHHGDAPNHEIRRQSIYEGIDARGVDTVVLDVPEPWAALPHAAAALRNGGVFAAYVVGTTQLQRLAVALDHIECFAQVECMECLLRPWAVSAQSVRPELQMIAHTGFLAFARRTAAVPRPLAPELVAPEPPGDGG